MYQWLCFWGARLWKNFSKRKKNINQRGKAQLRVWFCNWSYTTVMSWSQEKSYLTLMGLHNVPKGLEHIRRTFMRIKSFICNKCLYWSWISTSKDGHFATPTCQEQLTSTSLAAIKLLLHCVITRKIDKFLSGNIHTT